MLTNEPSFPPSSKASSIIPVQVVVQLKKGILDATSKTLEQTLHRLKFKEVVDVKTSTCLTLYMRIPFSCDHPQQWLEERVEKMCAMLLANPVSQDYTITVMPPCKISG